MTQERTQELYFVLDANNPWNILYSKEFPTNAFFDKGKIISLGTFYANFHSCYRDYNGFIIEY